MPASNIQGRGLHGGPSESPGRVDGNYLAHTLSLTLRPPQPDPLHRSHPVTAPGPPDCCLLPLPQMEDLYEDVHIVKLPLLPHEVRGADKVNTVSALLLEPYKPPSAQ